MTYIKLIEFKITGNLTYLKECNSPISEAYNNILKLGESEIYADLGAYNGDTVLEFMHYINGKYKKIYALEPNLKNYKKLVKNLSNYNNIEILNAAAYKKDGILYFNKGGGRQSRISKIGIETPCRSVDSVCNGGEVTFIKFDVEGAEMDAINGSRSSILTHHPKMTVALYHRSEDIFEIPLQINKITDKYKFYIRQFPYYPAWEINLFCVPNENLQQ